MMGLRGSQIATERVLRGCVFGLHVGDIMNWQSDLRCMLLALLADQHFWDTSWLRRHFHSY